MEDINNKKKRLQEESDNIYSLDPDKIIAIDRKNNASKKQLLKDGPVIYLQYKNQKNWPIEYVSENIKQFGYSSKEWLLKGFFYKDIIHPDDIETLQAVIFKKQTEGLEGFGQKYRILSGTGDTIWVYHHLIVKKDQKGRIIGYGGYIIDITQIRELEKYRRLAQIVFENTIEGIVITDLKGTIQWVNDAFTKITGYTASEAIGQNPRILKSERHGRVFYKNMWQDLIQKGKWQGEIWNRRKDGETYPEWLTIATVSDKQGNPLQYVSVFNDMTENIQKEEHIKYQTYHDALTGLPNRFLFKERLDLMLSYAYKQNKSLALMHLNIDRFKRINGTLGYAVGDIFLQSVAKRLQSCLSEGDTVARLCADEFIFILGEVQQAHDAAKIANRILHVFQEPFIFGGHELYMNVSMGISMYPSDGVEAEDLMEKANISMQWIKRNGGNDYKLYTSAIDMQDSMGLILENDMFKAIKKDQLFLCYQPQVELSTGRVVGVEALIRWKHPELGNIPPMRFIPLAEKNGYILELGEWVLRKACKQLKNWHEKGFSRMDIAVNLSTLQFRQKNLTDMVAGILKETRLNPQHLEMEITETSAMQDPNFTVETLKEFTRMGIKIAIDDFGTGYSSLAYLKRLPLKKLKIDQSFIQDIDQNEDSRAIVSAIIAMSHNLGINVLAEGVETKLQFDYLKKYGCGQMQGYYVSPPVEAEDFEKNYLGKKLDFQKL